ncbi:hypothetical protein N7492_007486 [Penicillium capsulatum]|uniref:Zn(2)-C6 fungal-type domain-containing protein n=1 Tax=Penicillium capsulatum TaxID=69766 RepID=A0A9W9LLR0_9EURO|nr:hypothetical protein N7492_007486 [Penicillium capsulatum]KAJ6117319.1 hypothetical protein N7512_007044 [Penicillium capsulatum]
MPPKASSSRPVPKVSKALRNKEANKAACNTCRSKKVRCSGTVPCVYCSKRGLNCEIPEQGQRRLYSILYEIPLSIQAQDGIHTGN